MASESQQYDELTRLYATYGDAELNELGSTVGDLTEVAQQALKAEFTRRGLSLPAAAGQGKVQRNDVDSLLQSFAANAPEDCTFEFTEMEEALLAQSVLRSAGIESFVPSSEIGAGDTPRVIVAPPDAQNAKLILSRPNALGTMTAEEAVFTEPVCPQCGAGDPLLESVEPTNQWRCEACGHLWQDSELA